MTSRRPVRFAFCRTCRARERTILNGRCFICGQEPHLEHRDQQSDRDQGEPVAMLILNDKNATVPTWSERSWYCIPHGPAQVRESVYLDPDGRDYVGDVVYIRRQLDHGSEYGWCREGLAYTNRRVLPRITLRTKADAIATLVDAARRLEL